jgi:hypothetical protein
MKQHLSVLSARALALLGALIVAGAAQAQPVIHNVYPDGTRLLQSTNLLSFGVTSGGAGINPDGVSVRLVSTNTAGRVVDVTLTSASGLTVGGSATERSVTAPLSTNVVGYSARIVATDSGGLSATNTVHFDTLKPAYSVEAEDFNYNQGQWLPEPQLNGYSRDVLFLPPVDGVDVHEGNLGAAGATAYRDPGLFTEGNGDVPRSKYADAAKTDYNVGWFDSGDWGNYTRPYPAGVYNVYYRVANGSGGTSTATISRVTSDPTQPSQTTELLGSFTVPNTGWQTYRYYAMRNADGSLAQFTLDGTTQTLRLTCGGGQNANFFALFPANTNAPTIQNIYPNGTRLYQTTNTMSFGASSTGSTIDATGISVLLTFTTIAGQTGSTNITSANGLVVGGTPTERLVSLPIRTNILTYKADIRVTDANGNFKESSVTFGTARADFSFEAEDYDYDFGKFIAGEQTNGYAAPNFPAVEGVDTHVGNVGAGQLAYRNEGLQTEATGDVPRAKYSDAGLTDYNVGWHDNGNWGNYTRNVPAGVFNVYARAASGGGGGTLTLAAVTGGVGTFEQTTTNIGTFTVPSTAWQTYVWVPLKDSSGNLVKFTGGSKVTLRSTSGGGNNVNFYAFFPADVSIPTITDIYPNGTRLFQQTNAFGFKVASPSGIAQGNVQVEIDGQPVSGLVFQGSSTSWTVSYPGLTSNRTHTASIRVEANNGSVQTASVSFDTFSATAFTVEAEAFNHTSGQFFDNPTQDSYGFLGATENVDAFDADLNNGNYDYRVGGLNTEVTGDVARTNLVSDFGYVDYNVGWFDNTSWGNYTRTYPAGTYNVYLRAANGTGNASSASLAEVTSDRTQPGQTTTPLGTFPIPATSGWQSYAWVPLTNGTGGLATVTLDGTVRTLRLTSNGGNNANFFILTPAPAAPVNTVLTISRTGSTLTVSFPTQAGLSYQVQRKQALGDASWSPLGAPVAGDGTTKSVTDTTAAGSGFYRTSATVQP